MEVLHVLLKPHISQKPLFQFHWRCKELNLFVLSFADDLLLFCKANPISVGVLKVVLDQFATKSRLGANVSKSQLFLSKSASDVAPTIQSIFAFPEGKLANNYLGAPLATAKLSKRDCMSLLDKINVKISAWGSHKMSFAGSVQLLKSMLSSSHIYQSSAFVLPTGMVREIK